MARYRAGNNPALISRVMTHGTISRVVCIKLLLPVDYPLYN
jgi:hypothetical protein